MRLVREADLDDLATGAAVLGMGGGGGNPTSASCWRSRPSAGGPVALVSADEGAGRRACRPVRDDGALHRHGGEAAGRR